MTAEYSDITSVTAGPPPTPADWSDELFRQRDEAIAEALVWRKRNADLAAQCARLRMKLIENGIEP